MTTFVWPADDGWPYPDEGPQPADPGAEPDEDRLAWECMSVHALDGLDPLERLVVAARFGVGGNPVRSMKDLQAETGRSRAELRQALGSGLAKLRLQLT